LLREFPGAPDPTTQGMISLARGDTAQSRRSSLQSRRVRRGRVRGSDVDREFRRARLALALGDSAAAADELDPALRALPILGTSLFDEFAQITSLIRAFILRADLAANWGDTATAREYADAVATSWRGADSPLQPVVRRMALLARTTPIRH